jgi:ATP-binding cassette subfamily B protein
MEPTKQRALPKRTLHYFWQEIKPYRRSLFAVLLIAIAATVLLDTFVPLVFSRIVDRLATGNFSANILLDFWPLIATAVGLLLVGELLNRLRLWIHWKMELKVMARLDLLCFQSVANQSMTFHNNRFSGSLVNYTNRFVSSYETLQDVFVWEILPFITMLIASGAVLFRYVPVYAAILLGVIAAFLAFTIFLNKRMLQLREASAKAGSEKTGKLADAIGNILTVKSYARETDEKKRYQQAVDKVMQLDRQRLGFTTRRHTVNTIVLAVLLTCALIFIVGGTQWFGLSLGTAVLIYTYTQIIFGWMWGINNVVKGVIEAFGNATEMTEILEENPAIFDTSPQKLSVPKGDILFDNITFRYNEGKVNVFQDFTLVVKDGERVGLVGISGSGKTTLTKLLLRFSDVEAGAILIDGQNIKDVSQKSLRENIAYVPQESLLFHRSIAENVSYGREHATREEIITALKLANAWEFVKDLPEGLETLVGERGVKLSGGQRQRIAIARAILKDAPILVLDEATSALDSESEALIQDALQKLMKGRTSVVIAHRLSTVASLDKIVVLADGKIVESGTHQYLLKKGGAYAKLWARQTQSYETEGLKLGADQEITQEAVNE